ncbi:hypothetical protein MMC25_000997 [Agyrium rufum]|nr:hypothetical protein [Agyrium rufum]
MNALSILRPLVNEAILIGAIAFLPFALTYLVTFFKASVIHPHGKKQGKVDKPPMAPYFIPWVGHALAFFVNPTALALHVKNNFRGTLVRLSFFNVEVNMISGFDAVTAVWRAKCLDSKPAVCIAMERFFGTPKEALEFYGADDSGISLQPHPMSQVERQHRVYFHTHKVTQGFMTGPGLAHFTDRFQSLLKQQIDHSGVKSGEWIEMPCFFSFLRDMLSTAAITTMCGPSLLEVSPTLISDLWEFDRSLPYFFKGYPKWLAPKAWAARKRCLDGMKRWHQHAVNNFTEDAIEEDGHDKYYGAPLMRSRQEYFSKMESLNADALASENIGLMWAENANSVPATCWYVLEAMRDPTLLQRVRGEVQASFFERPERASDWDVQKLCSKPLLQSVFAETLRLRTIQFIVRGSDHEDFNFKNFHVPAGKVVAVDTHTAHTDPEVWGTGSPENPHPIKDFWADRFLIDPTDPNSGPLKDKHNVIGDSMKDLESDNADKDAVKFSLNGLGGAWVPFGGGRRQCPGRVFAKYEIILSAAIFCSAFDIEFLDSAKPEPNLRYYGLGGLPPKKKIPFRVRRRTEYRG